MPPNTDNKKRPSNVVRDVSQQETFRFVPKLIPQGITRPAQVTPELSNDASRLAENLGLVQGLVQKGKDISDEQKAKKDKFDEQEGSIAAVKAKRELLAFQREVEGAVGTENELTPEEITQRLDQIQQKHLNGKSEAFQNSFLPQARVNDEDFRAKVDQIQFNSFKKGRLEDISLVFEDRLDIAISKATGIEEGDLERSRDSLELSEILEGGITKKKGDMATEFKALLNEAQNENPNIPKDEITEVVLETFISRAKELGIPEILDFTELGQRGDVPLSNTKFRDMIREGKRQATVKRALKREDIRKINEQRQKQEVKGVYNQITEISKSLGDPQVAQAMSPEEFIKRQEVVEDSLIKLSKREAITNTEFSKMLSFNRSLNRDVPIKSDPTVVSFLTNKAISGEGDISLITELAPFLTPDDRVSLASRMRDWEGDKPVQFTNDDIVNNTMKSFDVLLEKDPITGRFQISDGPVRRSDARDAFMREILDWERENGSNKTIPSETIREIRNKLLKEFTPTSGLGGGSGKLEDNKRKAAEALAKLRKEARK